MLRKLVIPFSKQTRGAWLEGYTHSEWGSGHAGHREKIRTALEHQLTTNWSKDVSYSEFAALKDLDQIPTFKKIYVSISHGQDLGGFVIAKKPVGFDLELRDRVMEKIVRRVSTDEEVQEAPSFAHLWAAKEATFKALRSYRQPNIASELILGEWQNEHFHLKNENRFQAPHGFGTTWVDGSYIFAVFLFL